jgi:hypothetical protein
VETQRGFVGAHRYDWGVADVQKFEDRLVQVTKNLGLTVPEHIKDTPIDWDAVRAEEWAEWRALKAERLLSRLEPSYRQAEPRHELSGKWLAAYDEGRCVNLAILGKTGTGKTWELAALTRALLVDRSVPVVFARVPAMLEFLKREGDWNLGPYQAAPVLALDDLGAEKAGEWQHNVLYQIADYREAHGLPTLISSNLSVTELNKPPSAGGRYDERLTRRLFQRCAVLALTEVPDFLPRKFSAEL